MAKRQSTVGAASVDGELLECGTAPSAGHHDDTDMRPPEGTDSDDGELAVAECLPNGRKLIECFVCGAQLARIHQLRAHLPAHAAPAGCDEQCLEKSVIYGVLNPHRRNIATQVIRDFVAAEITAQRHSQFYCILSEADVELHISDSETETETESEPETEPEADAETETGTETELEPAALRRIPQNVYGCDLCARTFGRRYRALFHQRVAHSRADLRIACCYCGRRFIGTALLVHHLKTRCENDEQPIGCVERFRQYLLKVNLEQFDCLAQARQQLKIHRLSTAARSFTCGVCQKRFLRAEHLTRHKAVHLPDALKMECPVCFKKFNRKDNLRTHMKVHMDEAARESRRQQQQQQAILCQYCGHCFASKSQYVVHMRRHTGEKPYTCEQCSKGFVKSTDLKAHQVTHTGERNFPCSVCGRAFTRSAVLAKHMRVHRGPYRCTYCEQSFKQPSELANHLRDHTTDRANGPTHSASLSEVDREEHVHLANYRPAVGNSDGEATTNKEQLMMAAAATPTTGNALVQSDPDEPSDSQVQSLSPNWQ